MYQKKASDRNCQREGPDVNLTGKDFKVAIVLINTFTELKESFLKVVKEDMVPMLHQIENINKEIEILKKN